VVRAVARGKDSGGGDDETAPAWAGGEPAGGGARVRPRAGRIGSSSGPVETVRVARLGGVPVGLEQLKVAVVVGLESCGGPIKVWGGLLLVRPICSGIAQLLWCDSKKNVTVVATCYLLSLKKVTVPIKKLLWSTPLKTTLDTTKKQVWLSHIRLINMRATCPR